MVIVSNYRSTSHSPTQGHHMHKYHLYAQSRLLLATNSLEQLLTEGDKLSTIYKLTVCYNGVTSKFNHFKATSCTKMKTRNTSQSAYSS